MKVKLRLFFTAVLLTIGSKFTMAQNPTVPTVVNVIPPSPEAQSFMRYGQIPVDVSTGVPNIEIPLYQITSGKLSLPVSITYHSSGIKVNDIASVVGLGWRLSAGGVLTKAVLGKSDNDPSYGMLNYPYRTKSQIDALPQNGSEWDRLYMISQGQMDGESDKYFYSAGDKLSGEFIYSNSLNIIPTTSSDNKVISLSPTSYEVIAEDGTKYFYEAVEYTRINMDPPYVSSWWLSRIVSADGADTITFEYETSNIPAVSFPGSHSLTLDGMNSGVSYGSSQVVNTPVLLKKIIFKTGYISFDYQGGRQDMLDYKLSVVSIYSAGSTSPLKKYQFSQSYFNSIHDSGYDQYSSKFYYRMKLDQLSVYDAAQQNMQNYSFEYDQLYNMPPYDRGVGPNNDPSCWSQDYFGYFNGASNQHLITGFLPTPNIGADRNPDFAHAKTCILKKINYPTGGSTSFEYQLNDGSAIGNQIAGGLRVHRVISTADGTTIATVKRYEYANNILQMDFDYFNSNSYEWRPIVFNQNCGWVEGEYTTYISDPILPFANFNGSSAIYQNVEEYDDDNVANTSLKKTYFYTVQNDAIISIDSRRFHNQYYREIPWKKGQLQNVSYYKSSPTTGYFLNKSENYSYSDFRTDIVIAGTRIERTRPHVGAQCGRDQFVAPGTYQDYFTYFDIPIEVGVSKLTGITTIETDDAGNSVTSSKVTSFGSPYHLFPTSVTSTTSTGDQLITNYKYPVDFSGSSPYDLMAGALHILSPVIQQDEYKNSTFLSSLKTDYSLFNSIPLPAVASTKTGPSAVNYDPRIQYLGYDSHGLVQGTAKVRGSKACYIYSYNGAFPVAQITNVDYSTVLAALGGQTAVDNFRDSPSPSDATVNSFLAPLRTIADVQVTTFTYQPLVGMTSQTDPKGMTTYYGYDSFQRLITVKNHNGHILKTYCYNYAGQVTDCSSSGGTTPSGPTQVYARIEVLNPTWSAPIDGSTTEADIYVALYSDAACTQPVSLPQGFDVNVSTTGTYFYNNNSSNSSWTNTYSVPANTNRVLLGRYVTDSWYSYYDPYYGTIINSENYTYQVEDNGANVYIPSPTY